MAARQACRLTGRSACDFPSLIGNRHASNFRVLVIGCFVIALANAAYDDMVPKARTTVVWVVNLRTFELSFGFLLFMVRQA